MALAVMAGVLWNYGGYLRPVFNLGGLVNWHTIWYPVFPVTLVCFFASVLNLCLASPTKKTSY